MFWDIQKFNREIAALKILKERNSLRPLTREQIKLAVLRAESADVKSDAPNFKTGFFRHGGLLRYAAFVLAGFAMFGTTVLASQNSLPGDFLYPVKRVSESLELKLAVSEESKARVETKHAERRLSELSLLENERGELPGRRNDGRGNGGTATSTNGLDFGISTSSVGIASGTGVSHGEQIRAEARLEAQTQINKAVSALTRVRIKLEDEGNTQAASVINDNIIRLKEKAASASLELETELNPQVQGAREGNRQGSPQKDQNAPGTRLPVRTK